MGHFYIFQWSVEVGFQLQSALFPGIHMLPKISLAEIKLASSEQ